jgi:hypothetical protein
MTRSSFNFIENLIHSNKFLSCFFYLLANEGNWSWAHEHEPLLVETAAVFWTAGRPNTQPANRDDCVIMVQGSATDTNSNPNTDFQWKDTGCVDVPPGVAVAPICQHDDSTGGAERRDTSAAKCLLGWSKFGGHCYLAKLVPKDWRSAEADCATYPGGHLVSLHSAAENEIVDQLVSGDLYWIGGKSTSPMDFVWTDGSAWDYERGTFRSSLYGPEDCPYAGKNDWHLLDCSQRKPYVCKI